MKKGEERNEGLKKLRQVRTREPEYHCDNCNCDRYSPCGCTKVKNAKRRIRRQNRVAGSSAR